MKEYLLCSRVEDYFRINEKSSHSMISELSIAYLLQFDDDSLPLTEAMLGSMPLALYAATHWIDHAKLGGMDPKVLQLILCLFKSESAALINWVRMQNIDAEHNLYVDMDVMDLAMDRDKVCSALYYSSLAGMQEVVYCLLHNGENPNAKGGILGNALQAASSEGYEEIVKLLLKKGAEVNAEGGYYGNALYGASINDNEVIVQLLIENGAEVNVEGGSYGNALQAASYIGNKAIVKLLLEKGAEVNAEGGFFGNALHAALSKGNGAIVKLLIENGANIVMGRGNPGVFSDLP